jgi:hypothetical protein
MWDVSDNEVGEIVAGAGVDALSSQEQYAEVQAMYEARVTSLETKLAKAKQRCVVTSTCP